MKSTSRSSSRITLPRPLFMGLVAVGLISLIANLILLSELKVTAITVRRVVDGDSLDLSDGRRVRLLGIDAPELGRCMGPEAREHLVSLAEGKTIELADIITDDYGRQLANVTADGVLLNEAMVGAGMARFIYVTSPVYQRVASAHEAAKAENLGIYSPLCRMRDPVSNCEIKGNIREGVKRYYPPECTNYKSVIIDQSFGDEWFCTASEAEKAGFTLSPTCR